MLDHLGISCSGVSYNNCVQTKVFLAKKWAQNYMGAHFQAPRAAPGQRLMEMHHVH